MNLVRKSSKAKLLCFTSRTQSIAVGAIAVVTLIVTQLFVVGGSASGQSLASDKAQAAAMVAQLNSLGNQVSTLAVQYSTAEQQLAQVQSQVKATQSHISQTQAKISVIKSKLTQEAISTYMTSGNLRGMAALLSETPEQTAVRQEFLNTVSNSQADLISSFQSANQQLSQQQKSLKALSAQAANQVKLISSDKIAVQASVDKEQVQLASMNSTISALVAQQEAEAAKQALIAQQQKAAQEAAARAAAAAQAASAQRRIVSPSYPPPPATPVSSSSGYGDPLRAVRGLYAERIDQGVDFAGSGPIFAIGNGVVLSTYNSGWPGGTFIAYRLTSGPAKGLVVYAAENIEPLVSIGQSVTSNTVIGQLYEGPDGMETGWANSSTGSTMALSAGQFSGANSTAFGFNFSQLLQSVGAPGGVLQNSPTGSLPSYWPHW